MAHVHQLVSALYLQDNDEQRYRLIKNYCMAYKDVRFTSEIAQQIVQELEGESYVKSVLELVKDRTLETPDNPSFREYICQMLGISDNNNEPPVKLNMVVVKLEVSNALYNGIMINQGSSFITSGSAHDGKIFHCPYDFTFTFKVSSKKISYIATGKNGVEYKLRPGSYVIKQGRIYKGGIELPQLGSETPSPPPSPPPQLRAYVPNIRLPIRMPISREPLIREPSVRTPNIQTPVTSASPSVSVPLKLSIPGEITDKDLADEDKEYASGKTPQSSEECNVCFDRKKSALLLPCRHFILCVKCAAQARTKKACPLCREKVENAIKIF
jgi:hypothetical protein